MSTYLLDTSVLIDTLRGRGERPALLRRLLEGGHLLACCAINVAELVAGMRPRERAPTMKLLDSLEHYDITRSVAERAGTLRQEWARRGRTLTIADLLIASIALEHRLVLVTDNVKDFPMPELSKLGAEGP
ncbi:MAG TPA: type II toxin-antitoxin system VapC family toxin [Thermoanaerobaculia bacterium]|nr:type II toxin-antitoxin system VapC family toxin [Thermoanaerobaculia bacterium]